MIWSQGRNNTVGLFLIQFVETNDCDNCQNVPCDCAYNNAINCKEYLLDNSTAVLMRLYASKQILCWGLRATHTQKGFVALFEYILFLTLQWAHHSRKVTLVKALMWLPPTSLKNSTESGLIHVLCNSFAGESLRSGLVFFYSGFIYLFLKIV